MKVVEIFTGGVCLGNPEPSGHRENEIADDLANQSVDDLLEQT